MGNEAFWPGVQVAKFARRALIYSGSGYNYTIAKQGQGSIDDPNCIYSLDARLLYSQLKYAQ